MLFYLYVEFSLEMTLKRGTFEKISSQLESYFRIIFFYHEYNRMSLVRYGRSKLIYSFHSKILIHINKLLEMALENKEICLLIIGERKGGE